MTMLWLIVWFIFGLVGDKEPLELDPVNVWTGLLILAITLDLAGGSTPRRESASREARFARRSRGSPAARPAGA
jgi:hypothetical protein